MAALNFTTAPTPRNHRGDLYIREASAPGGRAMNNTRARVWMLADKATLLLTRIVTASLFRAIMGNDLPGFVLDFSVWLLAFVTWLEYRHS